VEQRPDVLSAEAQLHAASAQVGVAVASRLPEFTLTGSLGSAAPEFSQLLTPGTGFWTAGADVAHTLFAGGSLLHTQRAAQAAYVQAEARYRSTVLAALQSVADALTTIQYDASVLKAADAAEKAAEKSLKIARLEWKAGLIGYPEVQAAELAYQQALLALILAQASRLSDTASLFQALGGGWWNRPSADSMESVSHEQ
jgi:NodT family efflux transporter outer membrane factor (OMF) lipoprotein